MTKYIITLLVYVDSPIFIYFTDVNWIYNSPSAKENILLIIQNYSYMQ